MARTKNIKTTEAAPVAYKQSKADMERERKWQAESGMRTLQEAEAIKNDKRRMNDIKALAKEQVKIAQKFCK